MVTNHLDKIFGTHGKFPGVQLKRSKTNKHSYQVEVKVKGAVPSRNINFGTYDSLEGAKRAYNYGSYILNGRVDDLPYFSTEDNRKLQAICPEPLREQLNGYIQRREADKIIEMRNQYIKKYVADCQCAEDSTEFKTRVRAYWIGLDMSRGQIDPGLLLQEDAQGPGSSPTLLQPPDLTEGDGNAMHEEAHCDTGEANVDQHEGEGTAEENRTANNMHDEPERRQAMDGIFVHQEEQNVLISNHAQMRGFAFRNKRSSADPEYPNLPKHYYGIITHAGSSGKHEYPPQINPQGKYVCACFFNHSYISRFEVVYSIQPAEKLSDFRNSLSKKIRKRFHKYHGQDIIGSRTFNLVSDTHEIYNYEPILCVQGYYEGPLPIRFLDQNLEPFDIEWDLESAFASDEEDISQVESPSERQGQNVTRPPRPDQIAEEQRYRETMHRMYGQVLRHQSSYRYGSQSSRPTTQTVRPRNNPASC